MEPLTLVLAVLVGVVLGLFGGGGSILLVPLLTYVADLPAGEAVVASLVVVGVTAGVAAVPHARAGRVDWGAALRFGAAGVVGAYLGGRLGALLDDRWLLVAFGIVMVATALAMMRGRTDVDAAPVTQRRHAAVRIVVDGVVVGLVTGLVGAGGGFLVVPALALLAGLPLPTAVGTSLVVIALKSGAGVAGHLSSATPDWETIVPVLVATAVGAVVGARLVDRVAPDRLRSGFGWLVLVIAGAVLGRELPGVPVWGAVAVLSLLGLLLRPRSGAGGPTSVTAQRAQTPTTTPTPTTAAARGAVTSPPETTEVRP